jgi:hypothetical protein
VPRMSCRLSSGAGEAAGPTEHGIEERHERHEGDEHGTDVEGELHALPRARGRGSR